MSVPPYDFWLLDLDGTVIDVDPAYLHDVMAEVGARVGHDFTPAEAETVWYGLGGPRRDALAALGLDPADFWSVFHEVEDPLARAEHSFLYDDVAFVADLDRPVGLVTHSQQWLTDAALSHLDIGDWFDAVVCCSDDLGWKPDPAPVRRAVSALGVDTDARGFLAGDGPQDVGAAWNAGLDGIHVERHGHDRRGMCVLGDRRVTRLDELLAPSSSGD
ncbi:HAD family hydrolase [Halomarina ordinaria]|uniref:HAD family hydrolase n=1 Tax=Halomarina ordinaria TaxID=3033939 RepID=A0ABD5U676_9EURY|nr:HAD hydrolase-like protein [Halomarina sp. PSRA2]